MALPQLVVVALLFVWGLPIYGTVIAISLAVQLYLMSRLLENPRAKAPWYNATGVSLYVLGMLIAAIALRPDLGVL
jgi:chlorophyll synthase